MSAFFLYSQANRTRVKDENPSASFGEIVSLEFNDYMIVICLLIFDVCVCLNDLRVDLKKSWNPLLCLFL